MKKIILLVLSVLLFVSAAAYSENWVDYRFNRVDRIVGNLFDQLEQEKKIFDNGYYSSTLVVSAREFFFGKELTDKDEIIKHMEETMFTKFAYANLSDEEKNTYAKRLYQDLISKRYLNGIRFHKMSQQNLHKRYLIFIEYSPSCRVATPNDYLLITFKGQKNGYLLLSSDVCD